MKKKCNMSIGTFTVCRITSKAKIENPFIMFSHFSGQFIWNKNLENDDLRLNSFYTSSKKLTDGSDNNNFSKFVKY